MSVKVNPTKGTQHYVKNGSHAIATLSASRLAHIKDMMCNGIAMNHIASVIQDEWELMEDLSEQEVMKLLRKYKAGAINPADIVEQVDQRTVTNAVREVKQHMNTLEVYADMVEIQKRRINMAVTNEVQEGKLSRIADEAMGTMNNLLKNYSDIAIKVGLLQRMMDGDQKTGPTYEPENLAQALGNDIVRTEMINTLDGMLSDLEALPPPTPEEDD